MIIKEDRRKEETGQTVQEQHKRHRRKQKTKEEDMLGFMMLITYSFDTDYVCVFRARRKKKRSG